MRSWSVIVIRVLLLVFFGVLVWYIDGWIRQRTQNTQHHLNENHLAEMVHRRLVHSQPRIQKWIGAQSSSSSASPSTSTTPSAASSAIVQTSVVDLQSQAKQVVFEKQLKRQMFTFFCSHPLQAHVLLHQPQTLEQLLT